MKTIFAAENTHLTLRTSSSSSMVNARAVPNNGKLPFGRIRITGSIIWQYTNSYKDAMLPSSCTEQYILHDITYRRLSFCYRVLAAFSLQNVKYSRF